MPTSATRNAQVDPAPPSAHHGRARPAAAADLAAHRTEFRILGPLEVLHRGAPLAAGGQKRRALLARLLLEANRTVSVDALVDALWGDQVPSTAVKMVHIYVSQLRKVLPPGLLHTRPPGYVLEVAPEAVDLLRFERLRGEARAALDEGDAATAADRLRGALALWRGPALAEFTEPFACVEAAHIEERRLAALEDRIDADLALARHGDVIGELQVLVAAHPLRQRPHGQLMLALYRAGRHAEALDAYRSFRDRVQDELGIDPPATLAELEYRILNQDPALDPDAAAAPAPRAPTPRLRSADARDAIVGRAAELQRLERALDAAATGRGTTALLVGPAGIGKTRLADELGERARARGATVLTGRCIDLVGAALPYAPLVEAFRPLRDSAALDGRHELARLMPHRTGPPPAAPAEHQAGQSRLHLFEDVLSVLGHLSDRAPVVLVLEDLHWSDGSTLDLLTFLAHGVRDRPVLLLASWRPDAVQPGEPVHRLAAGLERAGLAELVELGPLADDEVAMLLARESGSPLPAQVTRDVCARAEGNPFFAQELLAAALRGEEALPRLLRDVLVADLGRLDPTGRSVLRAAAAVGREAPPMLLAAVLDLPQLMVLEALREAVDHDLLVPDGPCGTFRFRHALVAEAAYATLLPGERGDLHERIAVTLTEDPTLAACRCTAAGELAEHWIAAGRPVEALSASLSAARDAQAVSGLSEALLHLERICDLWEQVPQAEEIAGLALPTVLAWAAELAVVVRDCDEEIDARSLAAVLEVTGGTANVAAVAAQMGVSVDAASATLDALTRGGLIERVADGAFRAARLGVAEACELYPLVVVLESIAVKQSPPFDAAALAALRRANDRLRVARHDPSEAIVADDEFHVELTARCGDEGLLAALRPVKRALLRYEQVYMLEPERIERSVIEHQAIIEALERADHSAAAQRLRRNLTGGLPDLAQALER